MSPPEARPESESVGTVVVAGVANLAIAVAKLVAGLISGSAAMLSEAAHSVADTTTEVLLFLALRRGARPADERHPFGYGKESYVWAFFAAHVHVRRPAPVSPSPTASPRSWCTSTAATT